MNLKIRAVSALLLIFTLCACGMLSYKVLPEKEKDNEFSPNLHLHKEEAELLGIKEGGVPDWGLAISGGGIRSATFAIGVMKHLQEAGKLEKIQMASSASGGGYSLYWWISNLLADQDSDNSRTEGKESLTANVFDDDGFLQHTCELMTRSNFSISTSTWKEMLLFPVAPDYYRCSIERTFGYRDAGDRDSKGWLGCMFGEMNSYPIGKYKNLIEEKKIPYFIFNTTLDDENEHSLKPKRIDKGWSTGLFEFTPLFAGNQAYGYKQWSEWSDNEGYKGLPLSQISAISGAAARPLLAQDIEHPFSGDNIPEELTLSDGGHSENLAAIALIRRGVKNIIVVDGEMDSDLSFEAYFILKDRLAAWGLTLTNPAMDARERIPDEKKFWLRENLPPLKNGAFIAEVKDKQGNTKSTLYYLKMAIVGDVKKIMRDEYAQYVKGMKMVEEPLSQNALIRDYLDRSENKNGRNWQCELLNDNKVGDITINYKKWIREEAIYRANSEFSDNFPHYSTAIQSYYNDQLIAYIGLGYMQAEYELLPLLIQASHNDDNQVASEK